MTARETSVTRPAGKTPTFAYDGLNRLVGAIHDIASLHVALSQAWDSQSRLASRTDGKSLTTQYGYDALDRLSQVTYADASVRSYSYDDFGNLTGITSPNGASASFTYDALRRMLSRTLTKGASSETAHFAYNGLSRLVSASGSTASVRNASYYRTAGGWAGLGGAAGSNFTPVAGRGISVFGTSGLRAVAGERSPVTEPSMARIYRNVCPRR